MKGFQENSQWDCDRRLKKVRKNRFGRCPKCHKIIRLHQKRCKTCHMALAKVKVPAACG